MRTMHLNNTKVDSYVITRMKTGNNGSLPNQFKSKKRCRFIVSIKTQYYLNSTCLNKIEEKSGSNRLKKII